MHYRSFGIGGTSYALMLALLLYAALMASLNERERAPAELTPPAATWCVRTKKSLEGHGQNVDTEHGKERNQTSGQESTAVSSHKICHIGSPEGLLW